MSHYCDEYYAVYQENRRQARKEHTCQACWELIKQGQKYFSIQCVFNGRAKTIKRCARCQTMHEELRKMAPGEAWPDEKLNCGEEYETHWGVKPPPEMIELAFITPEEMQNHLREKEGK